MSRLAKLLDIARLNAMCNYSNGRNRHGAVLFYNFNQIVAEATNVKNRCFGAGCDLHAETNCILRSIRHRRSKRNCKYTLNGRRGVPKRKRGKLKLLVCRINAEGDMVNSKPCFHCVKQIKHAGVYQIYYTNSDGELVTVKAQNITDCCICTSERQLIKNLKDKPWLRSWGYI